MPADASADIASHRVAQTSSLFVICTALQSPRSARRDMGAARRPGLLGASEKHSTPPAKVTDVSGKSPRFTPSA